MSTPGDDAEAIRNKRLARLQAFQRPSPPTSPSVDTVPSTSTPSIPTTEALKAPATPSQASPPVPTPPKQETPRTTTPQPSTASPVNQSVKPEGTSLSRTADGLSLEEQWEDRTLAYIFRATVRPNQKTQADGYLVLDDLRQDLEEVDSSKPAYLNVEALDQIILSICSTGKVMPMDLLIGAWKRSMKLQRETPSGRLNEKKIHILKEARRMAINYALYCVTMPDMFDGHQPPVDLAQRLVADMTDDKGLPQEVLIEFVNRFDEEPDLIGKFKTAFVTLSVQLSQMNMTDNYKAYVHALGRIAHIKALAEMYVNMPHFLHAGEPQNLELFTLLGPYFRISPTQPPVYQTYFANAKAKPPVSIREAQHALRMSARTLQNDLFQIVTQLCKTSEGVRGRVLDFFATVINANKKRAAMQVDYKKVASDGFMLNISAVLGKLCEPFMDSSFSKISRIEVEYFRRSPRLDIKEDTKLNADNQSSDEFYSHTLEGKNNFITEVFFLTAAAHHFGLNAAENNHDRLLRDIPELERHLQLIEAERVKYQNTPQGLILDRNIAKIKARLDDGYSLRFALESIIIDPLLSASTLLFMRYQMVWLLRLVDPTHNYPTSMVSLPLPLPSSQEFNNLPEYFIEDVGQLLSFVGHYTHEALIPTQLTDLLVFAVTFLRSSAYIKKANVKSKLVEIIYLGIYNGSRGYLTEKIHSHSFVLQHLMHALMNFYIEIEAHYYEKFTVRYHISKIIQQIWSNTTYRERLEQESDHNVDFFVSFVNMLLNDVTYVLDNALTALAEIHKLQKELEAPDASARFDSNELEAKEKALRKAEKDAQSYMQLGNETVAMLNLFTSAISDAFVQPEIVGRLAGMLDFNLEALVGDRCSNLRVRNPDKYHFNPRALLGEIVTVYLNLRVKEPFIQAIARDGRSYRPRVFENVVDRLTKHQLKSKEDIEAMKKLAEDVAEAKRIEDEGELELGEIPGEFCDPLLATLMTDPVILPTSGVTVDRQTIKSILLSDAKDPFNRSPLKIEEVLPDTEMKTKIDAWIAERRAAARAERENVLKVEAGAEGDKMEIDG
ncbi:hypothetical protein EX30DRAFT_396422 [Ascodesmis nigricans]|uniref:U-box domain-containing protein n=1 Tax=Ascodesmis nigricans TaxID=341454 RepID=A0A4S2MV08_9PEZI|nr:hypothetical protein EX30DRAFT_396422 [Ascodesmis nigricans]